MNSLQSVQNQSVPSQVAATEPAQKTPHGVSESDHMVYLGFIAMLEAMALSEDVGASLADMSKTIYDTLVVNGTEKVKSLQNELDQLSFAMDHWDEYAAYVKWEKDLAHAHDVVKKGISNFKEYNQALQDIFKLSGHPPAFPAEASDEMNAKNLGLYNQYAGRKSSMRSYVNGVSQQLSVQNTFVSNNKRIGDNLQQEVKGLVNDQSVYAGLVTNLLRVVQRQLQYGHR